MRLTSRILAATAGAAFATGAFAQAPGDIIFTNNLDASISMIGQNGGAVTPLFTFMDNPTPAHNLKDLIQGPNGTWFFGDGPFPIASPSTGTVWRLDDLFGTPTVVPLASGGQTSNPLGMVFDAPTNNVLYVNNPGSDQFPPMRFEGILGANINTLAVTEVYEEDVTQPRPRYQSPQYMNPDPMGNGYLVASVNGSTFLNPGGMGQLDQGSGIFRLNVDGALNGTVSLVVDLGDTSATGLSEPLLNTQGIIGVPGTNRVFVGDRTTDTIYEMLLNPDGSFGSITPFLENIDAPNELAYDPFNDRLVFSAVVDDATFTNAIMAVNLDGTGLVTLVTGVEARGIVVIPTPSALALLGLGGLAGASRRRRA